MLGFIVRESIIAERRRAITFAIKTQYFAPKTPADVVIDISNHLHKIESYNLIVLSEV